MGRRDGEGVVRWRAINSATVSNILSEVHLPPKTPSDEERPRPSKEPVEGCHMSEIGHCPIL